MLLIKSGKETSYLKIAKKGVPLMKWTRVYHSRPHFDEILCDVMLDVFGENKFPGISKSRTVFWSREDLKKKMLDKNLTPQDLEKKRVLLIGIGGGRFDEHPTSTQAKKVGHCAATLLAEFLEINDDPCWRDLLNFARENDLNGKGQMFDLACMIKLMYLTCSPREVFRWAKMAIKAKHQEQVQFHDVTRREYEEKAFMDTVIDKFGKPRGILVIESDNELVNRFARSPFVEERASIVIQKKSGGHVQIITNRHDQIDLFDTVKIIRVLEMESKSLEAIKDVNILGREGVILGAEEWYYHATGQMLLNGSLTANGTPPTNLDINLIVSAVKLGINANCFEKKRGEICRNGYCSSSAEDLCPYQRFCLERCLQLSKL